MEDLIEVKYDGNGLIFDGLFDSQFYCVHCVGLCFDLSFIYLVVCGFVTLWLVDL